MMHLIKVWDVSLCKKKKIEVLARIHEMEHLTYDLELSIVEHGGTIYLGMIRDICEDHKNLRNIFTKVGFEHMTSSLVWY